MAKRNWRKWLMRRAIGLVIGTALALGFFYYAKGVLSDRLLEKAKAARAGVFDDPDLAEANLIFDRLMDAASHT